MVTWTHIPNFVKNDLSRKLLWNKLYKCAYCERYLIGLSPEIDHFVHKGTFVQFTFNATNVFYSCRECNSSSRKGQKPTISNNPDRYDRCDFIVIHPFIHNVETEIIYSDPDRIDFDIVASTPLGRDTIAFFRFDDYEMTNIRSRQLMFERRCPLEDWKLKKLILEAVAYR